MADLLKMRLNVLEKIQATKLFRDWEALNMVIEMIDKGQYLPEENNDMTNVLDFQRADPT